MFRVKRHGITTGIVMSAMLLAGCASTVKSSSDKPAPKTTTTVAKTHSSVATAKTTAKATKPAAPPKPKIYADMSGSGIKKGPSFEVPIDEWKLKYSYDCSNFGGSGNFIVDVEGSDGMPDIAVNELGASGKSNTTQYGAGRFHLEVNSECNWHVVASEF